MSDARGVNRARDVLVVRGNATADEVAAVLAVVTRRGSTAPIDGYTRWRRARLAATRPALASGY